MKYVQVVEFLNAPKKVQDSICIIDGDYTSQVDSYMYQGCNNGMKRISEVFRGQEFYGEVELKNIYRSKIAEIADEM